MVTLKTFHSFKRIGIPFFKKSTYFQRTAVENLIRDEIKKTAENPDDGVLVVYGEAGIGKSTLMARLLSDDSSKKFFGNDCKVNIVIWINCYEWRNRLGEDAFYQTVVTAMESETDLEVNDRLSEVRKFKIFLRHYEKKGLRCVFVLDDLFNYELVNSFYEKQETPPICIVITRDGCVISEKDNNLQRKALKLEELVDEDIVEMWKTTFKLKITANQMLKLAPLCCGLPLIASLIAARMNQWSKERDLQSEYKALMSLRNEMGNLKVKDKRRFKTVSKLVAFNFENMPPVLKLHYYAFLMFNPSEPVSIFSLGVLWEFDFADGFMRDLRRICQHFEQRSLIRRVEGKSCEKSSSKEFDEDFEDKFLVHHLLFNATIHEASSELQLARNLSEADKLQEIRVNLSFGEINRKIRKLPDEYATYKTPDDSGLAIFVDVLKCHRYDLSKRIIDNLPVTLLADICLKKSPTLTKDEPLLRYWENMDYNHPFQRINKESRNLATSVRSEIRSFSGDDKLHIPRFEVFDDYRDISSYKLLSGMKQQLTEDDVRSDSFLQVLVKEDLNEINRVLDSSDVSPISVCLGLDGACRMGKLDIAKAIIKKKLNSSGYLEVFAHIILLQSLHSRRGLSVMKYVIEEYPEIIKSKLFMAIDVVVTTNDSEFLNLFLRKFPECLLVQSPSGITTLMKAAVRRALEICSYIADRHPDALDDVDVMGNGVGVYAAVSTNLEIVKFFVNKVKSPDQQKRMFIMACSNYRSFNILGTKRIVEYLVGIFSDDVVNALDFTPTPITAAVEYPAYDYNADIVKILCENCTIRFSSKRQALMRAVELSRNLIADYLLSTHGDIAKNLKNENGETPVQVARRQLDNEMLQTLKKHGYDE